jgi:hypothetical protein
LNLWPIFFKGISMSHPVYRHLHRVVVAAAMCVGVVGPALAQSATQSDVEKTLKSQWAPVNTVTGAQRKSVTVHSVKLGKPVKATLSDVGIDGVPKGATVTPVLVDFTVREYYSNTTQAVRRVREGKMYKDSFGDWRFLSGSARGADVSTTEPAVK